MNALADKVHKQGMPHSDMLSITWPNYSTTIPISSSGTPVQLALNLLLLTLGWLLNTVAMLWSAYYCVAFLVCVLFQPVHSLSHPTSARLLFRNLFMETCFCSFLVQDLSV